MPTYIYRCLDCKHEFEIEQKITDPVLDTCYECILQPYSESTGPMQGRLQRVLQPTATVFKGAGFYATDYKDDN